MKRFFSFFLRIIISLGLIFLLFEFIDFSQLIKIFSQVKLKLLFFAFFLFLFGYILALFRWKMLLEAMGLNIPLKRILFSYLLFSFFNLFLPSTIGGDFARAVDLSLHTKRREDTIVTVFLDRLSGYFGLLVVCFFSLSLGYKFIQQSLIYLVVGIFLILFILFLILVFILFNRTVFERINRLFKRNSKISGILKESYSKIYSFKEKPKILINNLILSCFIQLTGPLGCYILAIALGRNISLIYFLIIIPIVSAVAMLPVSIGGLGIRDLSMVLFFSKLDISLKDTVFAISFLNFFFIVLIGLLGGIFYVFTFHSRWLQFNKKNPQTFF